MTTRGENTERFSLKRWSQRKLESTPKPTVTATPSTRPQVEVAAPTAAVTPSVQPLPVELPPVESLTFDSDFTAFLKPDVDPTLQRAALKQLFRDPRFNVMDGLDTYIDDYTRPDPIPPDMLAELVKRFDFTSAPPPVAAASEHEPAQSRPSENAAASVKSGSDRAMDDAAPAPVGAIADASTQATAVGTTVRQDAARESTAARDRSTGERTG